MWLVIVVVGIIAIFFIYSTLTDYRPKEKTQVYKNDKAAIFSKDTINIMSWNIGYCGMDKNMDFFYDGGTQTRISKGQTLFNIQKIGDFLNNNSQNEDFIFLQEVDIHAKRTYNIDEQENLDTQLPEFHTNFGKNYDVAFIPVPISKPYGHVVAGINTYSKDEPFSVVRYQYPGNFSWPKRLFMLDRCFLVNRYKLKNGKQLLTINLHNSAFDDGSLRAKQLKYLSKFALAEYKKGNYLIIGGDWNQRPPNFKPQYKDSEYIFTNKRSPCISDTIFPQNWKFVYQSSIPTNRDADKVWNKKTVPVTTIDFFLISPNVKCIDIYAKDLNFENSDHNPIFAKFVLEK